MDLPWDPERIAQSRANFEGMAREAGLPFGVRTRMANSRLALEAAEWARDQGPTVGDLFHRAVFRAYFVDGLNIGDVEVLADLAAKCGLDPDDLRRALAEGLYREAVQAQLDEARELGVTAVPTFVAGGYAVVGAHPVEMLRRLMRAVGGVPRGDGGQPGPGS
jgi:predicted DsbA family dithiol-disulfide isomerase